jgi:hypothetical protein
MNRIKISRTKSGSSKEDRVMRLKWKLGLILFCCGFFAFVSSGYAGILVQSTFDANLDGWTGSGANVNWSGTQGNPVGSLNSTDAGSDWAQAIAPAKFSGPWPGNGIVSADILNLLPPTYQSAFLISDGNTSYDYFFTTYATNTWQTFSASLNSAQWTLVTNNNEWYNYNPPIGNESLATVLQNVTIFHIRTDLHGGDDNVFLDNITVSVAAPLPSTLVLLGSALAGLGLWRRKRTL